MTKSKAHGTLYEPDALNMANNMLTIEIYRHAGTWCFTDEARGLLHEPFVLGIPEMIDMLIKDETEYKNKKYCITFSEQKFPTCSTYLEKKEDEYGGSWYELHTEEKNDVNKRGWLCPATLKFFNSFPNTLYFSLTPVT